MKLATDTDLDRIFSVPPVTEAPPIDPLAPVMCNKLDCRYNDCGACLQFVVQDFEDGEGECTDYAVDERKCTECGAEKQELWTQVFGAVSTWYGCPNGH